MKRLFPAISLTNFYFVRVLLRDKQVFCGGLPPETTEEEIRTYFGQFGNIEALELPMDKEKNVRRGFIFVTYETVAAADAAVKKPKQTINGKECDVKKATPKTDSKFAQGTFAIAERKRHCPGCCVDFDRFGSGSVRMELHALTS